MIWSWLGFAIGLGVGIVVTLGLAAGMKILGELAAEPDLPAPLRRRKTAMAALYLVGQLALAISSFLMVARQDLLSLGVGMVVCLLTLCVVVSFKL